MAHPENNIENGTFEYVYTYSIEYVYGIHEGSVNEGGGSGSEVYRDMELALELAEEIVKEQQEEQDQVYTKEEQEDTYAPPFKWRMIDNGHWSNGVWEVAVVPMRVI